MNVLFLESDQVGEYNCSNWRCVMPMRALNRAGHAARVIRIEDWVNDKPDAHKATDEADIVFIQRNIFDLANQRAFYWKSKGKCLVIDLDDSYENMTEETGSPSYELWIKGLVTLPDGSKHEVYPKPLDQLKFSVKLVGALSSPSKLICEDWRDYAKTYWFPNYLDLSLYKRSNVYREPGHIYLGWGGSMTHLISWTASGASKAVEQICHERKNVNLILMGDPRVERFFDSIPKKQRLAIGWMSHGVFAKNLSHVDIGLIPLYGEYDRRRSWIKTAEYSVMGIPWIGSEMEPTDSIATGTRVKNTPEDWYNAIKFYVDNLPALTEAATKSMPMAQDFFDIDNPHNSMIPLFEKIIQETK